MKALYFDCSSGICGNMVLGALTEIIEDDKYLLNELKKLNIHGYKIDISKKLKNEICSTFVDVSIDGVHDGYHNEKHHKHHNHRNLKNVNNIINNSSLDEKVKNLAKSIFLKVAEAESKVHNKDIDEIHFHEVGALDSIVDIIGTAILINKINPDIIYSSIINEGQGFIRCNHGIMSIPVPATSEILANSKAIIQQIDIQTELVTPTGAAIITRIAEDYIKLPAMRIEKVGYGLGSKDIGTIPNVLKVYYGELK